MLEFLIDNICVMFGGWMCFSTDYTYGYKLCFSSHLFLYSYEADIIQGHRNKNEKKVARSFNFTSRYIDDVLSLNNSSLVILLIAYPHCAGKKG